MPTARTAKRTKAEPAGRTAKANVSPRRHGFEVELEETAARLFARRGFAGTTLRDIADELGMSRSSLYNYVSSKEDLLQRLCAQYLEHGANQIQDLLQRADLAPAEKLELMVRQIVLGIAERPALTELFEFHRDTLPAEYRGRVARLRRDINSLLIDAIRAGARDGSFFVDDANIASAVIGNIAVASSRWLRPNDPIDRIASGVAQMAVRSVQRRAAAGASPVSVSGALDQLREDVEILSRLVEP